MSSKRLVRRKQCAGKIKHATEQAAITAMIHTPGTGLAVYRCKFCGSYHVGHMNKRQRQGRNARRAA
jgi:hypothetical protein